MNTSHTIRAHAQEVRNKAAKIKGGCQSGRKVVTHDFFKNDLPVTSFNISFMFVEIDKTLLAKLASLKKQSLIFKIECNSILYTPFPLAIHPNFAVFY